MSVFKVGQRVRIRQDAHPVAHTVKHLLGATATIIRAGHNYDWILSIMALDGRPVGAMSCVLEPIVDDPKADAFLERLKKLGREPVNTPDKVTV